ncbi:hypothetical protein [Fructobacillus parabroussonetiae]|uniref:Uncharacterized protein n=1 Tax=Fructobacillus parabroussonetiae TaxID=2713174 RepID=A0ABS5QVU7_9LACO|nr:hypothetical protein [Fructobacillus parabroussonetiae]MBS9337328.1 hypothetical protein [Fructobacillus parabroussonetiae]
MTRIWDFMTSGLSDEEYTNKKNYYVQEKTVDAIKAGIINTENNLKLCDSTVSIVVPILSAIVGLFLKGYVPASAVLSFIMILGMIFIGIELMLLISVRPKIYAELATYKDALDEKREADKK